MIRVVWWIEPFERPAWPAGTQEVRVNCQRQRIVAYIFIFILQIDSTIIEQ